MHTVAKPLDLPKGICGKTKVHIFYLVPWDFDLVRLFGHSSLMKIMDHFGRWQKMSDTSISSSLSLSCPWFYTFFNDCRTRGAILLFTWPATKATLRLPSNLLTACPILTQSTWLGWPLCKCRVKGGGLRSCLSCLAKMPTSQFQLLVCSHSKCNTVGNKGGKQVKPGFTTTSRSQSIPGPWVKLKGKGN